MLDDFIFVDEDLKLIEGGGYLDDESAEMHALYLSKAHKKTVVCYRHICTCDTFDLSAMREALKGK